MAWNHLVRDRCGQVLRSISAELMENLLRKLPPGDARHQRVNIGICSSPFGTNEHVPFVCRATSASIVPPESGGICLETGELAQALQNGFCTITLDR
jgi:hypothetical protein